MTSVADLYCWSMCAFSIRLSLARLFWNQILICVSVSASVSASSNLLLREMYSLRWYSSSSRNVCSLLNVVLCLRGLPSFLRRLATATIIDTCNYRQHWDWAGLRAARTCVPFPAATKNASSPYRLSSASLLFNGYRGKGDTEVKNEWS